MNCPRCQAPRVDADDCPRCGVIYARAGLSRAKFESLPVPVAEPVSEPGPAPAWTGTADDERLERRIRLFALPAALVVAWLMMGSSTLHFLSRTFMSMWLHELGHATTGWFCGFGAIPGPWATWVSDGRTLPATLFLAGGLAYFGLRGHRDGKPALVGAAVALFVAQLVLTFGVGAQTANMLIVFGGDAGALVWATALMSTMYSSPESRLRRGALRWGFLVIGAVTFMDVFNTWWAAHADFDAIPYGLIERVGLSDASKLSENHGWSSRLIVDRHLMVAGACGAVLAVVYGWGLRRR